MRKTSTPYHHTDLKELLLKAAVQLIAEVGLRGFTLREIARRAGVSHNAPYRHFRDRNELLGAVADQGFQELTEAMRSASAKRRSGPLDRLKASGLAYIDFALHRPEHFSAMFETPIADCDLPNPATPVDTDAFGLLESLVRACQEAGLMDHGDAHQLALVNWCMVHGIAKLAIAKRLPGESNKDILKFAKFVADKCLVTNAAIQS